MPRTPKSHRLHPEELSSRLPRSWIPFKTSTAELVPYHGQTGQGRAMRAIDLGLSIPTRGFNIFAAGDPGSGKTSILERVLNERASRRPVPPDVCYVRDFRFPDRPRPILLPPGKGRKLAAEMDRLVANLERLIPRTLADPAFGHTRGRILADTHARARALTRTAARAALRLGLSIEEDETSLRVVPLHRGKPITPETFAKLAASKRRAIEASMVEFQEHLDHYSHKRRQLELDHQVRLLAAEARTIAPLVSTALEEVRERFTQFGDDVAEFLVEVEQHILDNHRSFLPADTGQESTGEGEGDDLLAEGAEPVADHDHRIYKVNVIVDRTGQTRAPVVVEQLPTAANLCGFFEYRHDQGRLVTDHTMIRAGALHQANGGYLLLQVAELLSHENAWDALKRALRHKNIRIEEEVALGEGKTRIAGAMKPDPVPLTVKVVLVGSSEVYYLLKLEDEDFSRLFKVKAEFEPAMPRTRQNVERLARFLGQVCREEGYLALHASGLERLIEAATRRAEHKERMTTHRAELLDLMAEADFYARGERARTIRGAHVQRALEEIRRRHDALACEVDHAFAEGAILLRTDGMAVGQLNGIALYDLAGSSFGVPVRITVRTYAGRRGVVNIDREVELSGAIHDKGALILVGYLGGRYAQAQTLGVSASVTFEQSYDEIDGDSASSAELYAVLSSLSGCPIRQGIAVTGSVNQLGEVQPIGGVNEKIEGIFRVCQRRGLNGEQGVLIPRSNVRNLMLSREVIEAVRAQRFSVHAVSTIDEGIEVLTGVPSGKRRADGSWTPGSISDRVERRLRELQEVVRTRGVITSLDSEL
jgi:lon-related putative ATP-dependent protease